MNAIKFTTEDTEVTEGKCSMQNDKCKMFNAEDWLGIFHFELNILHFAFFSSL